MSGVRKRTRRADEDEMVIEIEGKRGEALEQKVERPVMEEQARR